MRFAVMGPGLMSKRQKEARKRQSFPGGLAADLSQASGVAKKAAAPKQKAKGKKAKKARQGPAPPQKAAPVSAINLAVDSSSSSEDESGPCWIVREGWAGNLFKIGYRLRHLQSHWLWKFIKAWQFRAVQKLGARQVQQIRQSEETKRQASGLDAQSKQARWLKSFSEDLIGKFGETSLRQIAAQGNLYGGTRLRHPQARDVQSVSKAAAVFARHCVREIERQKQEGSASAGSIPNGWEIAPEENRAGSSDPIDQAGESATLSQCRQRLKAQAEYDQAGKSARTRSWELASAAKAQAEFKAQADRAQQAYIEAENRIRIERERLRAAQEKARIQGWEATKLREASLRAGDSPDCWVAIEVRKLQSVEAQAVQVKAEVKEEVASPEPAPADNHLRSALFDAATLEEIKLEGQVNDWLAPVEKCSECAVSAYGFCHCDNCTGSY